MKYALLFCLILLASCRYLTPTIVPPLTDELGYHIPSYRRVTVLGLVEGAHRLEAEKMKLWGYSVRETISATDSARSQVMDLLTVVGLGGTAAIPAALKKVPRGYKPENE